MDQIVEGARAHDLHRGSAWFGTWKNGNMHYVPAWVKSDSARFPRVIRPDGEPIDVLSPHSQATLEADKAAFVALMRHLKQMDGEQHTVSWCRSKMNRATSAAFATIRLRPTPVRRRSTGRSALGQRTSSRDMGQVFGADADEIFQMYYQAKYINEIAAAGKAEFNIPVLHQCRGLTIRAQRNCRSGRWIRRASRTRAAAQCKNWLGSGARWPRPST